ncbi:MAG: FAD-binding oxidoreductase [Chlamydiales bacterium]|nr:FAD-binding oxidoreductase [Chlamydiales bacterium]
MQAHRAKVEEIQKEVRSRSGELTFSSKAVSNALRSRPKRGGIDLSGLDKILEIDRKWVVVEPRVTFQQLCTETLKQGLIPPVVPEFTTITVGGAVMGAALESSSHRFGQVSDTCLEYEVILGNGELVRASPDENSDLYYALSGSYGTLAILTKIKLRLIKAEKYVQITCRKLPNKELIAFLNATHSDDFVEGIALNHDFGVALTGKMTSKVGSALYRQKNYWSPWYIQHLSENRHSNFYMTIEEYCFRFDKGAFWMGQYILSIRAMLRLLLHIGIPRLVKDTLNPNLLFRLLFGWALSSRRLYRIWHHVPNEVSERLFFVHDFYAPSTRAEEIFTRFVEETGIFPIWLCPVKGTKSSQFLSPHYGGERFLNIGLYGTPKSPLPVPELSAKLEKEITLYGGRKMLYSYTYYERDFFSKLYDEVQYNALRRKFFAEKTLPHIYNKIVI